MRMGAAVALGAEFPPHKFAAKPGIARPASAVVASANLGVRTRRGPMLARLMYRVTDFGDAAVVLAVAAAACAWLCWRGRWRAAAFWLVVVLGCVASTVALKLAFYTGDVTVTGVALRNPSGHAALSAAVYGSLAWIVASQAADWRRPTLLLLGILTVAAIAVSRRYLHVHSTSDVAAGLLIGTFWAALFIGLGRWQGPPEGRNPVPLLLLLAAVALAAHGSHLPVARMAALVSLPPGFAARL
jgi:undecaprenyl-diphosphatase